METFIGHIKTTKDALILFESCRLGELRRVKRRLCSRERSKIKSGSIFAFDESESGMCRWTDGRTWSPSRVLGSFLTYRELDTKRRPRKDGKDSCSYKPNGLIKQSFSICTSNNQKMHLISYYSKADIARGHLRTPSEDPAFAHITIPKGIYPELNPLDTSGGHSATLHLLMSATSSASSPPITPTTSKPYFPSTAKPTSHQQHPPSLSSSPVSICSDDDLFSPASSSSSTPSSHTISPSPSPQHYLPSLNMAKAPLPPLYILQSEDYRQLAALRQQLKI